MRSSLPKLSSSILAVKSDSSRGCFEHDTRAGYPRKGIEAVTVSMKTGHHQPPTFEDECGQMRAATGAGQ